MTFRDFSIHIFSLSALSLALCYASCYQWRSDLFNFGTISIIIYLLFNIGIFLYAQRVSSSKASYTFNGIVSASFIIKLLFSIALLAYWQRFHHPSDNYHIALYILVYIIYTIYEVYFLTLLAKKTRF